MKGGFGGERPGGLGKATGFQRPGRHFRSKIDQKSHLFFDEFLTSFCDRFGRQKGAKKGAKIDQDRAKLGPRRLLKRFFVKKMIFHETL